MKRPAIKVSNLHFHDGTSISFDGEDLVLITGPNNSGKSSFLRELHESLQQGSSYRSKIIRQVEFERNYSEAELLNYLEANAASDSTSDIFSVGGVKFNRHLVAAASRQDPQADRVFELVNFFVEYIRTAGRIESSNAAVIFDRTRESPNSPIQWMFKDEELEAQVSAHFRSAFGYDLILHRQAMKRLPLYVGQKPPLLPDENWASTTYLSRLEQLDLLEDQGDGMRSFVTIVASLIALDRSIILIDEPEAFLHPPQARLLGRFVAAQHAQGKQIFVATHSSDFIKGVMESKPKKLKFGRLTRGTERQVFWIDPADTHQFLNDPLLRTSNALDGLLHEQVVLTEGDRDSVFYQAMLNALTPPIQARDRLFLHTGGKHRMPLLTTALSRLGVNPIVIADIDLLRTEEVLKALIEARGGQPDQILTKVRQIKADVEQSSPPVTGRAFKGQIATALTKIVNDNAAVPQTVTKDIGAALKEISPWSAIKDVGKIKFKGQVAVAYNEVDTALRLLGIWLVPVGELEGFLRTGSAKGQGWLLDALSRDLAQGDDLDEARKFIARVFSSC